MVAEIVAAAVALVATLAELLHARRVNRVAMLAFGPHGKPAVWARVAPGLRVVSLAALSWGLTTLYLLPPKLHQADTISESDIRHVVLVLDVSPSMRLEDAGPSGKQSRMQRARDVMESFFQRVAIEQFRLSVIATYNGASPVVVDTKDLEVIRNILGDLPMHFAFEPGKTDLFAGLQYAAEIARPWNPKSTTLIMLSDGDTVSSTGMPKMPASVRDVVVVGLGDPNKGTFIDGQNSKQEVSFLRQIATRLGGVYHNGNEKHLATDLLKQLTQTQGETALEQLTRREYALIACGVAATALALLPLLLHYFGTSWQPGVQTNRDVALSHRDGWTATKQRTPRRTTSVGSSRDEFR